MRRVITFFIKYPVLVNLLFLLVAIFGIFGYLSLRSTFFPEEAIKFINIDLTYRGAAPKEMEEGVVIKIEDNLKSVSGIDRITSVARENSANIAIELLSGFDADRVLQDVKNAVEKISTFPVGMEPPVVYKVEIENFTFSLALSGEVDLLTLKKAAREVENDLRGQPGISKVYLVGFPDEEIEISMSEEQLQRYNLTFDAVVTAVRASNIEQTGGTIKTNKEDISIRARAREYYSDGLQNTVVRTNPDGSKVFLHQIATVKDQFEDRPTRSFLNGKPAVVVNVNNTNNEDILNTADFLRGYVEEFNLRNDLVKASTINDRSIPLRQRLALLTNNGIIGAILVFVFLALSLNIRLSFWTAIGIPFCFLLMFILAPFYGMSINVLSLFGMIIVVGILVDDGIVVTENIFQHYERGKSAMDAAVDGTLEVLPSITAAIATTMVAFSFFFFIEGRLGEFFTDIAFVVMVTLGASLVECVILLPSHIAHTSALKREYKPSKIEAFFTSIIIRFRDKFFAPVARFAIGNSLFSITVPISLFIITIAGFKGGYIKTTFFPNIEQESITATLEMPVGTAEDITLSILNMIEEKVAIMNEEYQKNDPDGYNLVESVQKNLGPQSNQGNVVVNLLDAELRTRIAYDVASDLRGLVGTVYGIKNLTFGSASAFGKPISISLTSTNMDELRGAKDSLVTLLRENENLKDIGDNDQVGLTEIDVTLKPQAYAMGFTLGEVFRQIRQGFFGTEIQSLQRGIDEVKVWARYNEKDRSTIAQLEDMRIRSPQGMSVPLSELAELHINQGVVSIYHVDGKREIKVEGDIANIRVSVTDQILEISRTVLPKIYSAFPTVKATFEGQTRIAAKTAASISTVGPVLLILLISISVINFRSFVQGFSVILLAPFAIIGVGWGHYLHGIPLSIFSMLGVIALIGVLVNDSLVYVNTYNGFLREGMAMKKALYETSITRFRPIILTSITTIAGLAPLMLETSFQAQFLIPMAVSLTYGLAMVTVLTLLLLPTILLVANTIKRTGVWIWTGEKVDRELLETPVRELMSEEKLK